MKWENISEIVHPQFPTLVSNGTSCYIAQKKGDVWGTIDLDFKFLPYDDSMQPTMYCHISNIEPPKTQT